MLSQLLRDIHRCERLAGYRLKDTQPKLDSPRLLRKIVAERLFSDLDLWKQLGLAECHKTPNPSFQTSTLDIVPDGVVWLSDTDIVLVHLFFSRDISYFGALKAAVETWFLQALGYRIHDHIAITLNTQYTRKKTVHLASQFGTKSIRQDVHRLMPQAKQPYRWLCEPTPSAATLAPRCFLPHPCSFQKTCFGSPQIGSIFDLHGLPEQDKRKRFQQGIHTLPQVPPNGLTAIQQHQITWQEDHYYINKDTLPAYLKQIHYPITCLDFEAVQSPIALYTHTKAFQLTPFLFSAHTQHLPGQKTHHHIHICPPGKDPHYSFARALIKTIPKTGSILVYDPGYEKIAIQFLIKRFPRLEAALQSLIDRMIDLSEPFRKHWVYHKRMQGRSAFKYILPAMVADLGYQDLVVENGEQAATLYALLVNHIQHTGNPHPEESCYLSDLSHYCARDTWGLYRVFEALQGM